MPSDFKRGPRLRDPAALARFRLVNLGEPCERCERRPGVEVHHRNFRSRGGDDVPENFAWLCRPCHDEAHHL
jgi:5-methylcytosine-specific restriction endonuclease McrA